MKTSQQILSYLQQKHDQNTTDELLKSVYEDIILFIIQTDIPSVEPEWNIDDWDEMLDLMDEQKADEQINLIKSIN